MYDDLGEPEKEKPRRWNHALGLAAIVIFSLLFWSASKFSKGALDWPTDFEAAKTRAAAEHKPILILFSADWCPPCNEMKRTTWPDANLKSLLAAKFVAVYLNIDRYDIKPIAQRFKVEGIPHITVADAAGNPLPNASVEGYRTADEMIRFLKNFAAD